MNKELKIYKTKDYNLFKTLGGNRNINVLNVKRIIKSMKEKLIINPIIVNEKYEIIDGQHRFEALRELKKEIYYIVQEGLGLEECQLMNCNSKTWTNIDFLNGYCQLGKNDYIEMDNFLKKNNHLSLQIAEVILSDSSATSGTVHESFKNGSFKIKNIEKAQLYANWIKDFEGYAPFGQKNFALALIRLFKNKEYNHETMLKKAAFQYSKLQKEVNINSYVQALSDIYNYKSRTKVIF